MFTSAAGSDARSWPARRQPAVRATIVVGTKIGQRRLAATCHMSASASKGSSQTGKEYLANKIGAQSATSKAVSIRRLLRHIANSDRAAAAKSVSAVGIARCTPRQAGRKASTDHRVPHRISGAKYSAATNTTEAKKYAYVSGAKKYVCRKE